VLPPGRQRCLWLWPRKVQWHKVRLQRREVDQQHKINHGIDDKVETNQTNHDLHIWTRIGVNTKLSIAQKMRITNGLEVGATSTCKLDEPTPGSDVFTLTMSLSCERCLPCAAIVFTVFDGCGSVEFRRLLQPYHPPCRLGWTLDTDDLRIACSIHPP